MQYIQNQANDGVSSKIAQFMNSGVEKAPDDILSILATPIIPSAPSSASTSTPSQASVSAQPQKPLDVAGALTTLGDIRGIIAMDENADLILPFLDAIVEVLSARDISDEQKIVTANKLVSELSSDFGEMTVSYFGGHAPLSLVLEPLFNKIVDESLKILEETAPAPAAPTNIVRITFSPAIAQATGLQNAELNIDDDEPLTFTSFRELIDENRGAPKRLLVTFTEQSTNQGPKRFIHFYDADSEGMIRGNTDPSNNLPIIQRMHVNIRKVGDRYEQAQ